MKTEFQRLQKEKVIKLFFSNVIYHLNDLNSMT
jgi:hypothetical protein